ncbi:MAG: hypothetical protein MI923_12850 [Phycisphaerales bacterium]|nr:hypothetical protein [Phycisphaerales bacterium]
MGDGGQGVRSVHEAGRFFEGCFRITVCIQTLDNILGCLFLSFGSGKRGMMHTVAPFARFDRHAPIVFGPGLLCLGHQCC